MQTANPPSPELGHGILDRRLAFWIFAAFQFLYLLTSTGRVRTPDEYNTLYTAESLVLHGTTAVPQAIALHNFYGRLDVHGLPRAAYPPGQALACAPWYAMGQYILARLPGVPAEDTDLVVAFAACLSSATFAALTVMFFFLLLIGIGIPLRAALMATAMVGLSTSIFAYSGWLFSEPLTAAILTGTAWLLFGRDRGPVSQRTAAIAGLILGLATIVRPTNVLAIVVFAVAVFLRDGKPALRTAFIIGAAASIGVAILLVHNKLLFGSPFAFGYPTSAEGAKRLNSFDTPILTGLYGLLLSPGKSVFVFAPPIILAVAGVGMLWKRDRGLAALAVLLPVVNLLFYAKYSQWEGGYCVGPRYLVPALVLLCLALGPVLAVERKQIKAIAVVLLVLGALVQGVCLATSFMEDQAPRGHYYDAHWTYRLDYSLSGPLHLFGKYFVSAEPAPLGLGWDRWFVFLAKGGISRATLGVLFAAMAAGLAISLLGLSKNLAQGTESRSH